MRFYDVIITDPNNGGKQVVRFTSYNFSTNRTDPGALQVELDIPVAPYFVPDVSAYIRIWGVSLQQIAQSSDLNNLDIAVYGGMQKGLPLAKPQQSGLLISGAIQQAYGNWIGTEQTLDLQVRVPTGSLSAPLNIVHDWKAGTSLASAIRATLATAFPSFTANINISPNLVLPNDEQGFYYTLTDYAQIVKRVSQNILKGIYSGVDITITETTFNVYDGTSVGTPKLLAFEDMVGQPTWIGPLEIQAKLVMRADIAIGSLIKFPPAVATTSPQSFSQFRDKSAFTGIFQVGQVHHFGNFRQPDAAAWVTTVNSFPQPAAA